jgi:glucosamine-6-phosphate deaminase
MNLNYGKTEIIICDDNQNLGLVAAGEVSKKIKDILKYKSEVRLVLAAGESQSSFNNALAEEKNIDWSRVICFNIDDFWAPGVPKKFSCGYQTTKELYSKVKPAEVNLVRFDAENAEAECDRFEALIQEAPIDILCQGIGTSGHLALNEPDASDFNDHRWVRLVELAEQSKKQLIADPNFRELGYIPEKGITMTIPAILAAKNCYTMVPLPLKKCILTKLANTMEITEKLPASVLLNKPGKLFVDRDSCPDIWLSK